MNGSPVGERVRAVVGGIAPGTGGIITSRSHLIDDLQFDSLNMLELAVRLEREFSLDVLTEQQLRNAPTVGDVELLITQLLGVGEVLS